MQRVIMPAMILLLIAAIVIYLVRPNNSVNHAPPPGHASGSSGFVISNQTGGMRVLIEAEDYREIAFPAVLAAGEPFPATILSGASNGKSCYIGPEKWNDKWKKGQVKGEFRKGHEEARNPGFARYEFTVPEAGDYVLWVRAFWVDDCGNSIAVSIDGCKPVPLTGSTYGRWLWFKLRDIENEPLRIRLDKAKKHVITICNREDDLYFDQILLLGADLPVDPMGVEK